MNQGLIQRAIQQVMPTAVASGLFVSLATFQLPDGLTDSGFVSPNYVDVAGLVNIPCTAPPLSTGTGFSADEAKAQAEQTARQEFHVLLSGYFPAVDDVWRGEGRVVIDGLSRDILGVEHDSQSQMTRVKACNTTI